MDMHGFTPVDARELDLADVRARRLRHDASGAELLVLASDEPNLSFAVGFPTLPSDDTGVAHILEHMVLAGSERFPLKDPFFEMIKSSLAGFLNAMTYPDRTVYPFATEHPKDFLNLLDVYLDAVFRPRLSRATFDQEAWHLEPGDATGTLRLRGVVYNEMKGALADPNRALSHAETAALLPDTAYRFESGGDPAAIPDLTYEALRAYHADHYHPGRARFVVHGDVPLGATLAALSRYLDPAGTAAPAAPAAVQAPFDAPRTASAVYPADERGKALATVAWALPAPDGPARLLALELLEYVLVGSPAAPLRRALLDAGLGEAFVGGLGTALRQPVFRAGLRGVAPGRTGEVHEIVASTLRQVAQRGVDPADVEAGRTRMEFDLRELDVHGGQRGLALALDAMGAWIHGRDPLAQLDYGAALAGLDRIVGGADDVTALVRSALVDNPHQVRTTVEPDRELSARRARAEASRLGRRAAVMDDEAHARVAEDAQRLEAHQREPDAPEALAALPRLARADLREARPRPDLRTTRRDGAEVVRIDLPTRGLAYLDLGFDLAPVPDALLPHVGLLGRLLLETGTTRRGLADLTRAIDRDTGGIGASLELSAGVEGSPGTTRFFLRGRALASKVDALTDLLLEVATEADLSDADVVRRLALEDLARRRAALEPAGHRFVLRRLAAHASEEGRAEEALAGLASLDALARIVERCDDDWPALRDELEALRSRLLVRDGLVVGVTADDEAAASAEAALPALLGGLPTGGAAPAPRTLAGPAAREGWALPGQVHYVGTGRVLEGGAPLPGGWLVAARWLGSDVLLPRIRFQGGAYGAGAVLDPLRGSLRTYSYRDPNLTRTLDVVAEAPGLLREAARSIDAGAFEALAIGAIGGLDPYALPGEAGFRALLRRLRGTEGQVDRLRAELLAADPTAFTALADAIDAAGDPVLVVLGPREGLEADGAALGLSVRDPG